MTNSTIYTSSHSLKTAAKRHLKALGVVFEYETRQERLDVKERWKNES